MSTLYPKINSVFKRDEKGRFTEHFATDEIAALAELQWLWTEKVDGTNVRLMWQRTGAEERGGTAWRLGGRTDNAQMPVVLIERLQGLCRQMAPVMARIMQEREIDELTLFGEGYGAKIQNGGHYNPEGVDFTLFDVKVGDWWLRWPDVMSLADELQIGHVPVVMIGSVYDAIDRVKSPDFASRWPGARPEGLVGRPPVELYDRKGERILTKIKVKDFHR